MKKKNSFMHVGSVSSPYKTSDKESMDDWYTSYLMDGAGSIEENGSDYYRVISTRMLSTERGEFILCYVDRKMKVSIGSCCIDELGNTFHVKGIETIHFCGSTPEWYWRTHGLLLEGTQSATGEFLAMV